MAVMSCGLSQLGMHGQHWGDSRDRVGGPPLWCGEGSVLGGLGGLGMLHPTPKRFSSSCCAPLTLSPEPPESPESPVPPPLCL